MRGVGACSGPALGLSLLLTLHPTTSSHLSLLPQCPMSPCPLPSVTPRELATVTVSLGAFPPLLETFVGKTLAGTMTLMGCVRAGRGESQGRQILGEN